MQPKRCHVCTEYEKGSRQSGTLQRFTAAFAFTNLWNCSDLYEARSCLLCWPSLFLILPLKMRLWHVATDRPKVFGVSRTAQKASLLLAINPSLTPSRQIYPTPGFHASLSRCPKIQWCRTTHRTGNWLRRTAHKTYSSSVLAQRTQVCISSSKGQTVHQTRQEQFS